MFIYRHDWRNKSMSHILASGLILTSGASGAIREQDRRQMSVVFDPRRVSYDNRPVLDGRRQMRALSRRNGTRKRGSARRQTVDTER